MTGAKPRPPSDGAYDWSKCERSEGGRSPTTGQWQWSLGHSWRHTWVQPESYKEV